MSLQTHSEGPQGQLIGGAPPIASLQLPGWAPSVMLSCVNCAVINSTSPQTAHHHEASDRQTWFVSINPPPLCLCPAYVPKLRAIDSDESADSQKALRSCLEDYYFNSHSLRNACLTQSKAKFAACSSSRCLKFLITLPYCRALHILHPSPPRAAEEVLSVSMYVCKCME